MALFNTIDQYAEHYPALLSVDWTRLKPSVELVEERYLRKVVLGNTLYTALHAAFQAATPPWTGNMANLHAKAAKPLAFLAAYEAIPDLSALFTSAGLRQNVGEGEQAAPMWLSNQTRDHALTTGHVWLDSLIEFLWENRATYTDWASSPMYTEVTESLVPTMTTADRHTRILGSAWLLHQLRPAMRTLQNGALKSILGATRLAQLVTRVHSTGLDAADQAVLEHARPALLYGALAEEAGSLRINVDRTGVYTLEGSDRNQMTRVERSAKPEQLTTLVRDCRNKSNYHLQEVKALVAPDDSAEPSLGGTGGVFRS